MPPANLAKKGVAMIVELVTFKTPRGWDRARVLEDAKHTVPKWAANRDLLRKHFALGIGNDAGLSAGVYIWPSVEAAQKAHDPEWRESVKRRSGGYPTIQYFDLFLLIDNEHGRVTEWEADGEGP
jgi:hypothetical protein